MKKPGNKTKKTKKNTHKTRVRMLLKAREEKNYEFVVLTPGGGGGGGGIYIIRYCMIHNSFYSSLQQSQHDYIIL